MKVEEACAAGHVAGVSKDVSRVSWNLGVEEQTIPSQHAGQLMYTVVGVDYWHQAFASFLTKAIVTLPVGVGKLLAC